MINNPKFLNRFSEFDPFIEAEEEPPSISSLSIDLNIQEGVFDSFFRYLDDIRTRKQEIEAGALDRFGNPQKLYIHHLPSYFQFQEFLHDLQYPEYEPLFIHDGVISQNFDIVPIALTSTDFSMIDSFIDSGASNASIARQILPTLVDGFDALVLDNRDYIQITPKTVLPETVSHTQELVDITLEAKAV